MIMLGLDYAAKHSEAQLREAMKQGVRFVVRYLTSPPNRAAKGIDKDEAAMLRGLGLGVVSVYQRRNTEISDFDREHAALDAEWALEHAHLAGQEDGVIYFAVDFDAPDRHLPTLWAYFSWLHHLLYDTPYEIGVYGSRRVVADLPGLWHWQTYAWSAGQVSTVADMLQCHNGANLAGGRNDLNIAWIDPGFWIKPEDISRPDMPTLKRGAKGWQVSILQGLLGKLGYSTNGIDGDFGPGTEQAMRYYQTAYHLDADGIAGPMTWTSLWPVVEPESVDPRDERIRLLSDEVLALQTHRDALLERMRQAKMLLDV